MRRILLSLACLLIATAARAGSLETAPTTIELSPTSRTGVFHVVNRAAYPVTFQVETFDWTQRDGEERLEQSQVLQASPPMAELEPGAKQTVRLRAVGAPAQGEQAFRLLISELPGPDQAAGQQVRVLLQFSVPVFAGSDADAEPALAWRGWREGGDLVLAATNTGAKRAKLSGLTVVTGAQAQPAPGGALTYVLAGATRRWRIPAGTTPPGAPISVQAGSGETARRFDVTFGGGN